MLWEEASGTLAPDIVDNIGDPADAGAGLVVLRITLLGSEPRAVPGRIATVCASWASRTARL